MAVATVLTKRLFAERMYDHGGILAPFGRSPSIFTRSVYTVPPTITSDTDIKVHIAGISYRLMNTTADAQLDIGVLSLQFTAVQYRANI